MWLTCFYYSLTLLNSISKCWLRWLLKRGKTNIVKCLDGLDYLRLICFCLLRFIYMNLFRRKIYIFFALCFFAILWEFVANLRVFILQLIEFYQKVFIFCCKWDSYFLNTDVLLCQVHWFSITKSKGKLKILPQPIRNWIQYMFLHYVTFLLNLFHSLLKLLFDRRILLDNIS